MISYSSLLYIVNGSFVTLTYSILSVIGGLLIGTILAMMKLSRYCAFKMMANFYTSIFRGTPLLIQLSIIYFALPNLIGIKLSVLSSGIIAFSLNSGAYVSEIVRSGLQAVDKHQTEAAKVLNISTYHTMIDIVLPQALRQILPSLTNELISLIKETSIVSLIGEADLMRRAQLVSAQTYDYFTPLCAAGCCYYLLVLLIGKISKYLESRFKW